MGELSFFVDVVGRLAFYLVSTPRKPQAIYVSCLRQAEDSSILNR